MASEVPSGGVVLAEKWKLVPLDDRNWELCHMRQATDTHGRPRGGAERWFRCGRFYSYNGVERAMLYVLDELWKAGDADAARQLSVDLAGYRACLAEVRGMVGPLVEAMRAYADGNPEVTDPTPTPPDAGDRDGGPQGGE